MPYQVTNLLFSPKTSKTSKAKSAGSPVQNALIFYFLEKKNEVIEIVQQRWRPHSHRAVSPNYWLHNLRIANRDIDRSLSRDSLDRVRFVTDFKVPLPVGCNTLLT